MKKYLFIIATFLFIGSAYAQYVLPVPVVIQEHDQWCWAGCSKCILNYYGDSVQQCDIAEYTRTVATWHNYGWTPCCTDPTLGCNYPNLTMSSPGSLQDILVHFDGITSYGMGALSLAQMDTMAAHFLPFVCHWSWMSGGGHFVVGNGVDTAGMIHYMNPAVGEGAHICTDTWMMYDGSHTYDQTMIPDHCPLTVNAGAISGASAVVVGAHITLTDTASGGTWHCSSAHATVTGGVVTGVSAGWDTVMYTVSNPCGMKSAQWPVHITAPSIAGVNGSLAAPTNGMEIYPNPNKGSFKVQFFADAQEPVHIVITNVLGSQVMELDATTNSLVNINLDQPTGIYIISASTAHGNYVSKVAVSR